MKFRLQELTGDKQSLIEDNSDPLLILPDFELNDDLDSLRKVPEGPDPRIMKEQLKQRMISDANFDIQKHLEEMNSTGDKPLFDMEE